MNCKHNYARVNEPRAYSDSMINRGRTAAHHRRSESQPTYIYTIYWVSHFIHEWVGFWDIIC